MVWMFNRSRQSRGCLDDDEGEFENLDLISLGGDSVKYRGPHDVHKRLLRVVFPNAFLWLSPEFCQLAGESLRCPFLKAESKPLVSLTVDFRNHEAPVY
ncbi:hypothetical protein Bca101_055112 [Brassica carinata]